MRDHFSAAATGILIALSLPPYWLYGLIWVAFVPLLAALQGKGVRARWQIGLVAGVAGYATAYAWLPQSVGAFFGLSVGAAVAVFVVFVLWHAVHFAVFAILVDTRWSGAVSVVVTALAWVVVEALFPTVFPFAIGNVLQPHPPFIQLAAATGVAGLSFLVILCNALVLEAWRRLRNGRSPALALALALGVIVILDVYGRWRLGDAGAADTRPHTTIALVQGNIEGNRETSAAWLEESLRTYGQLTLETSQHHPDLIVWPELSVRTALPSDEASMRHVFDIARQAGTILLIGAGNRDGHGHEGNAAFLVSPYGDVLGTYDKRRMLPFAERQLSIFRRLTDGQEADRPVRAETTSLVLPGGRIAPSICYEATFPGFFRDGVNAGAQLLVNITNDVWFGDTAGPHHHLQAAAIRAVESGRWLVRGANSGISAVIDAHGRIVAHTDLFERTVLVANVPLLTGRSFYVRWGEWFVVACGLALAGLWLFKPPR